MLNNIRKIWRPEAFRGAAARAPYFEGWYFRVESPGGRSFAFIPGISLSEHEPHSFLQVMDSIRHSPLYCRFPVESFSAATDGLRLQVDACRFSKEGFYIEIDGGSSFRAECSFHHPVFFPRKFLNPGIMGPFSFFPLMECRHDVVMIQSGIEGFVLQGGEKTVLDGGYAYVEKDWGRSFPDPYLWLQASRFLHGGASFMLSIASVPYLGAKFTGLIGFLYEGGHLHRFATYNGAKLEDLVMQHNVVRLHIRGGGIRAAIQADFSQAGILKAPGNGKMTREARESICGHIHLSVERTDGHMIFEDESATASVETGEDLLQLPSGR